MTKLKKLPKRERNYRPSLMTLKGQKKLVGCEIGVNAGVNSFNILKKLHIKKLYLIDPYMEYEQGGVVVLQDDVGPTKRKALRRLEKWKDKIVWIYKTSEEAHEDVPDGELDFVYIDGNHEYEYVKRDIELYEPKVKDGGLIAGHDYNLYENDVNKAVHEIYGDRVNNGACEGEPWKKVAGKKRPIYDWWVWKNDMDK